MHSFEGIFKRTEEAWSLCYLIFKITFIFKQLQMIVMFNAKAAVPLGQGRHGLFDIMMAKVMLR